MKNGYLEVLKVLGMHIHVSNEEKSRVFFVFLELTGISSTLNFGNQWSVHLKKFPCYFHALPKIVALWLVDVNADVSGIFNNTYLFLVDGYPVCGGVPLVTFDVINTIFQIPVALRQINLQQIPQKVL